MTCGMSHRGALVAAPAITGSRLSLLPAQTPRKAQKKSQGPGRRLLGLSARVNLSKTAVKERRR